MKCRSCDNPKLSGRSECRICFNRRRRGFGQVTVGQAQESDTERLFKLTKSASLDFVALCDRLDLSPGKTRSLIEKAQAEGKPIKVKDNLIGVELPTARDDVQDSKIAPTIGERQRVAVISDTHYGSRFCLRGAIKDFIAYAHGKGAREVLHPGDMLDGDYKHGRFEMTHMGLARQIEDMRKNLPALPGLTYHSITGNHDWTFTEGSGVDVGQAISDNFLQNGRNDFKSYGDRGAFIRLRGVLFHLWHPSGGLSYAKSYKLQRKCEHYSSGMKPQVLLVGHYHTFGYVEERSIHALLCPTFQSGGSAFSNSLTSGAPSIGGLILEWDVTVDGTIRNFSVEKRTYMKKETAHRVEAVDEGIEVG